MPISNYPSNFSIASSDGIGFSERFELKQSSFADNTSVTESTAGSSIAGQESRNVLKSKFLLFVVLLLISLLAAIGTYIFLVKEEEESWVAQFELQGKEILDVSTINAFHIFDLYKAMALRITMQAITSGDEWPFVTFPFFETEADLLINQTKTGQYMALHPLVNETQRKDWERYTVDNQGWISDGYEFYGIQGTPPFACGVISKVKGECVREDNPPSPFYAPLWQVAPAVGKNLEFVNYNAFEWDFFQKSYTILQDANHAVLSKVVNLDTTDDSNLPESFLSTPIHETSDFQSPIVGILNAIIPWHDYFMHLLPEGADGIVVVVNNDFQAFSYAIDGPDVHYLGPKDLHDTKYDYVEAVNDFAAFDNSEGDFGYTVHVYPTDEFVEEHSTNHPVVYTAVVVTVFIFTACIFVLYDVMVERRQAKVLKSAKDTGAIVNSLFPKKIRDRMIEDALANQGRSASLSSLSTNRKVAISRPLAELFPQATVMFADISNFTAWSSVREPSQVFFLLESLYNSFDKIARRMRIFKVETIGDCYVAAAGLPEPRRNHAVVMASFASKCLSKMVQVVRNLEVTLGPETEDLRMRFGLHSGPVTAGVLRGEKARFQLFGDTVNTAARMESTGVKNRVQMTEATYKLIVAAKKESWVRPRSNMIDVKGKGMMQTYWLNTGNDADNTSKTDPESFSSTEEVPSDDSDEISDSLRLETTPLEDLVEKAGGNIQRLVLWNVENLMIPLKKLIASRTNDVQPLDLNSWRKLDIQCGETVLEEVTEIINLTDDGAQMKDFNSIVIDEDIVQQLVDYVTTVASLYNNKNPFHSFHHASHVAQSVTKLLSRVVAPESIDYSKMEYCQKTGVDDLHKYTYGITSDPLLQFSVIFAALIHDVDHPGVSNAQLVKEGTEMAKVYKNKSIAEQNSVDLAWELLMEEEYEDLRRCIYRNQEELDRFRKLVVNTLMATDVMDKELGALRKQRWEMAFNPEADCPPESPKDTVDRKATIVIEHMLQASDVSHTMQHWQVYIQWNEKYFHECYQAYLDGRAENDPSKNWYKGEIGFFDFYVIPLAKKLEECGVFGVSSHEYLGYAQNNRDEWERKGEDLVKRYLEEHSPEKKSRLNMLRMSSDPFLTNNERIESLNDSLTKTAVKESQGSHAGFGEKSSQ